MRSVVWSVPDHGLYISTIAPGVRVTSPIFFPDSSWGHRFGVPIGIDCIFWAVGGMGQKVFVVDLNHRFSPDGRMHWWSFGESLSLDVSSHLCYWCAGMCTVALACGSLTTFCLHDIAFAAHLGVCVTWPLGEVPA